jgi:DNA polymerase-3 subunit beta
MKFKVKKQDFFRELQLFQGIVDKKHTIPVLSNALIEASADEISLVASDTEVTMKNYCPADVREKGRITLPARKTFEIVKNLPEAEVEIELLENFWLTLKCENSQFRICGLDPDTFPQVPEIPKEGLIALDPARVKDMLQAIMISVPTDDTRFPVSGALITLSKEVTRMVSTDGHRLSLYEVTEKRKAPKEEIMVVVARKTLMELKKVLDMGIKELKCCLEGNNIVFLADKRVLISNTIQKKYPDYKGVFPPALEKHVLLEKSQLESAIRRVSVLSSDKARSVKLTFKEGMLTLSTATPEMGDAREDFKVDFPDDVELCFNYQYILDLLGVIGSGKVLLSLKDGQTQGVFEPAEAKGYSFRHVIMPMRV